MATIGQQLLTPDAGWTRINSTDAMFSYVSMSYKYSTTTYPQAYLYDIHESPYNTSPASVSFTLDNKIFRIISRRFISQLSNVQVYVNGGLISTYSQNGTGKDSIFFYESPPLYGVNNITIYKPTQASAKYFAFDCIDVIAIATPSTSNGSYTFMA